jgi:pimeloyl-ACP methyl ester carboxylesterase
LRNTRQFNYGTGHDTWELWHRGPVLDRENVVLVHGYRLPLAARKSRCDEQFARLDHLLQEEKDGHNVWQFEYVANHWGTFETAVTYAVRLGQAIDRIACLTGRNAVSIVAHSMGGIIARWYIAHGGKSRVDKLLTLAVPHLGTLRFDPFDLAFSEKILPRAAAELRPDSRVLWELNTSVDSSCVPEFAAIGGNAWGNTDGVVEMGSTSLARFGRDGSILEPLYFAGVKRSHLKISRIRRNDDEVFQLIRSFLKDGIVGISRHRPAERPGDYRVPYFLTFSLRTPARRRRSRPSVVISDTGRKYSGYRLISQGAKTDEGATIYTVQLDPDDDGEARIYYSKDEYVSVQITSGQSVVVAEPVG